MKTTFSKFKYLFLATIIALALGCSSEDGEDGAVGPQGSQGEQGPIGPAGADGQDGADGMNGTDGADGQDGNANVTSVLYENQAILEGNNVFDIPELTQAIYDTGIVYVYVTVIGNDYWEPLPIFLTGSVALEIDRIEIGRITLRSTFAQFNLNFRFVLVEGNLSSKTTDKNIQKMSYEEAMDYFGLDY
ncbi:MAG: hypothetical protein WBG90_10395 [Saonia sp.]